MGRHQKCKINCGSTDCDAPAPRIDLARYAGTYGGYIKDPEKPPTWLERFKAWRECTGFFMDGRDGGM